MTVKDLKTGEELKRVLCEITSGTTVTVEEQPAEVRLFSSTYLNGEIVSGWTYDPNNDLLTIPSEPQPGETYVAFSSGEFAFNSLFMITNMTGYDKIESGIVIHETNYRLLNVTVDIAGPNYYTPTIKWYDENGEYDFPYTVSEIAKDTAHTVKIRIYLDGETFGNYRDLWLKVTGYKAGVN